MRQVLFLAQGLAHSVEIFDHGGRRSPVHIMLSFIKQESYMASTIIFINQKRTATQFLRVPVRLFFSFNYSAAGVLAFFAFTMATTAKIAQIRHQPDQMARSL